MSRAFGLALKPRAPPAVWCPVTGSPVLHIRDKPAVSGLSGQGTGTLKCPAAQALTHYLDIKIRLRLRPERVPEHREPPKPPYPCFPCLLIASFLSPNFRHRSESSHASLSFVTTAITGFTTNNRPHNKHIQPPTPTFTRQDYSTCLEEDVCWTLPLPPL